MIFQILLAAAEKPLGTDVKFFSLSLFRNRLLSLSLSLREIIDSVRVTLCERSLASFGPTGKKLTT